VQLRLLLVAVPLTVQDLLKKNPRASQKFPCMALPHELKMNNLIADDLF
jgi:hypothetical protein